VVGVVRSPDTWLDAVWRYVESGGRKHITCGETWHSFLRQPMIVTHGQHDDIPSYEYSSPFDYWNTMSHSLLPHTLIRYEDAVGDPKTVCHQIAEALGLAERERFTPIEYRTRNMSDRFRRSRLEDYVTAEPFTTSSPPRFGWRDRRLLRRQLSKDLLATIY
jgi:hypothetical protein